MVVTPSSEPDNGMPPPDAGVTLPHRSSSIWICPTAKVGRYSLLTARLAPSLRSRAVHSPPMFTASYRRADWPGLTQRPPLGVSEPVPYRLGPGGHGNEPRPCASQTASFPTGWKRDTLLRFMMHSCEWKRRLAGSAAVEWENPNNILFKMIKIRRAAICDDTVTCCRFATFSLRFGVIEHIYGIKKT